MTTDDRRTHVAETPVSTHRVAQAGGAQTTVIADISAEQASSPEDWWAVPGQSHPQFEPVEAETSESGQDLNAFGRRAPRRHAQRRATAPSAPRDELGYDLRLTQRDLSSPLAAILARLQPLLGPIFTDPISADSISADSISADSISADPISAESADTESAGPELAGPELASAESVSPKSLSTAPIDLQAAVSTLSPDDLIKLIRDAEAVNRRLDALRVHLAGEVDARSHRDLGAESLARKLGCRNGVDVLQRLTQNSAVTVRNQLSIARAVRSSVSPSGAVVPARFAVTAEAFTAGLIGMDTTSSILRGLTPAVARVTAENLAFAEQLLVEFATGRAETGFSWCHADETREQARRALAHLDEDGPAPDDDESVRQRGLTFGAIRDGLVPVSGNLLPEVAAQLQVLFDGFFNPRTKADTTHPSTTPSTGTDASADASAGTDAGAGADNVPPDTRTYPQKMHDLLGIALDIAARSADSPTVGGNAPVVSVSVRLSDLMSATGASGYDPHSWSPPGFPSESPPGSATESPPESPPDTGFGYIDRIPEPISLTSVRRFACAGGIQKILLSDSGRILQLGSPERCFTPQQRKAISLRDGGCVIPGYMIPAGWCEVHHVTPHSEGGPTHTDNGVLLCGAHHRMIDDSGWEITMPGGVPHITPPRWIDPEQKTHRHINHRHVNARHVKNRDIDHRN